MGSGLPDVSDNPIVVYVAIGVVILLALSTVTDKGFGTISRSWYAFARNRRQDAADKRATADDIYERDHHALQEQVNRLDASVRELLDDQAKRDTLAIAHMAWDRQVRVESAAAGITLPEPPPLIPRDDD